MHCINVTAYYMIALYDSNDAVVIEMTFKTNHDKKL